MKYECIKSFRNIPKGAICDVQCFDASMTIYITVNGKTTVTNYATLKQYFKEVTK